MAWDKRSKSIWVQFDFGLTEFDWLILKSFDIFKTSYQYIDIKNEKSFNFVCSNSSTGTRYFYTILFSLWERSSIGVNCLKKNSVLKPLYCDSFRFRRVSVKKWNRKETFGSLKFCLKWVIAFCAWRRPNSLLDLKVNWMNHYR